MMNYTKAQRTAQNLGALIDQGQYAAGQKLPNENELSAQLGISRTTLREAIRILVSEGRLTVRRGSGTYVSDALNQSAQASLAVNDMKVTLRDLYEARLIFEPQAAALAARRAGDEEIAAILRLGEKVQQLIKEDPAGEARVASETEFHSAIIKASHNEFLGSFMPIINETIEKTFARGYNLEMIAEDAYKDHIMIMNFLEKRDAEGLRSAVMIHLRHALWNEEISLDD
ncbi:MAG: FadR family transcriptional regulator [Lachnospiraceae bacterium]|nr:FadR family transcriptional regulator [Lachnospiraceae bacterium]